jgi:hypothetical protein
MVEAGMWLSRKQRRSFHQPRLRRECRGELVQILEALIEKREDDGVSRDYLVQVAAGVDDERMS